jgi:selenide,water dikinase
MLSLRGRIAACNVLSDMYAMGVTDVDNVLMLLASSIDMPEAYRNIVTAQMIKGFDEQCKLAGTIVSGGQSVRNPWPIIGGVAQSICKASDIIMPIAAQPGDVLVLTKPIGTQLAVNAKQWMWDAEKWSKYAPHTTERTVRRAFHMANQSMMRLNRIGAELMHKHHAHAATDVTGFGILGHLDALCKTQTLPVTLRLHTLPILAGMADLSKHAPGFRLLEGYSAETSGGLLICMTPQDAEAYVKEIQEREGLPAWIVGMVSMEEGGRKAVLEEGYKIIEV